MVPISAALGNTASGFFAQGNNGGIAVMSVSTSTAGGNGTGLTSGGGTVLSSIRIANVSVFLNGTGLFEDTNGQIASFGNNFNSGSGTPNASLTQQ